MPSTHKLVRDNIPEIIRARGGRVTIRSVSAEELQEALEQKLQEEVAEYVSDKNGEELADIIEVVYALAETMGITREALEEIRISKAAKNGAFEKGIILDEYED